MSAGEPLCTLVLATAGRTGTLPRLIDSLVAQTEQRFELVVIDQNHDDRLRPYLTQMNEAGLAVSHLKQAERNLSLARNRGLAVARAPLVGFPDDDCWYEPECLARVCARAADPHAPPTAVHSVVAHWVESREARPSSPGEPLRLEPWRRLRGGDGSSIALFVRREALQRVGGFDPRLGVGRYFGAGEETDLVLRLLEAGEPLVRDPLARVHHAPPAPTGDRESRAAVRQRARGTGAVYAKHRLPWTVIARGLTAPAVRALFPRPSATALRHAAATIAGRAEGLLRWRTREPHERAQA